jgi:hypothetical protein
LSSAVPDGDEGFLTNIGGCRNVANVIIRKAGETVEIHGDHFAMDGNEEDG